MDVERKCINCNYYPCVRKNCGEVCEHHKFEHEKLIKAINKLKREGYIEFERYEIGGKMKINEYAVYKGDKFITVGTAKEIAEELNVKQKTVYVWACPYHHRRAGLNTKIAIKMDEGEI
jgi:hypothetical protein